MYACFYYYTIPSSVLNISCLAQPSLLKVLEHALALLRSWLTNCSFKDLKTKTGQITRNPKLEPEKPEPEPEKPEPEKPEHYFG